MVVFEQARREYDKPMGLEHFKYIFFYNFYFIYIYFTLKKTFAKSPWKL